MPINHTYSCSHSSNTLVPKSYIPLIEGDASHSAQLNDHSVNQLSTEMEKLKPRLPSASVRHSKLKL